MPVVERGRFQKAADFGKLDVSYGGGNRRHSQLPELVCTVRIPTPLEPRAWANYAVLTGLRHELEIRYAPDRRYARDGRRPDPADYGTIREKPAIGEMCREDAAGSVRYLKALTALQRRFADAFYGGRFTDDEGNTHLPVFRGKGQISLIDFNIERFNAAFVPDDPEGLSEPYATEETPGAWHGTLTYTLQGRAFGLDGFWKAGHGAGFETRRLNQ